MQIQVDMTLKFQTKIREKVLENIQEEDMIWLIMWEEVRNQVKVNSKFLTKI